jgi:hypothetical protein
MDEQFTCVCRSVFVFRFFSTNRRSLGAMVFPHTAQTIARGFLNHIAASHGQDANESSPNRPSIDRQCVPQPGVPDPLGDSAPHTCPIRDRTWRYSSYEPQWSCLDTND